MSTSGMRVAVLDSFPNLADKAELEFTARFHIAAAHLGLASKTVVTSDDIADYAPNLVISTHELSRKLTAVPTIGLIWSPLSFFDNDIYRLKSLLSYDGYLVGNEKSREFLKDLQFGLGVDKPIGDRLFFPSACKSPERAFPRSSKASLCYLGVHWDGARHDRLLTALAHRKMVTFYGPPASWGRFPEDYAGPVPFDGVSVQRTIAGHGIALCLHKQEHRVENMPSMRIFEALSVGAIAICDQLPFALNNLADIAFFITPDIDDTESTMTQIEQIVGWVNENPQAAFDRAARGRAWFEEHWSLEDSIERDLLPLYEDVLRAGHFQPSRAATARTNPGASWFKPQRRDPPAAEVDVVIRAGGRPLEFLVRAVDSVRAANAPALPLGATIVDYVGRPDIEAFCNQQATKDFPLRYLRSAANGFRSTTLWTGLKASTSAFVSHLDDDDTVFPNHYRQLHATLMRFPHVDMAYCGAIKFEEDSDYIPAPNFRGPDGQIDQVVPERRNLEFLEPFDLPRLARLDNYIQSNAWMARGVFLRSILGDDPEMVVAEDMYLYLLAASRGPLAFTGSATALWHMRSLSHENSSKSVDQTIWESSARRIRLRLGNTPFVTSLPCGVLARLGREDVASSPGARVSLPTLDAGVELRGGVRIGEQLALWGFHHTESDGVWTAAQVARLAINPSAALRKSGGAITLTLMPAPAESPAERWFEIEVEGGETIRRSIEHWGDQEIQTALPPRRVGNYRLMIRVSELLLGGRLSSDQRDLGIYLKAVRVESAGGALSPDA